MTPEPEVYQPFRPDVENQIATAKRFINLENRLDIFKRRFDLTDEVIRTMLEGKDVSNNEERKELLKWWTAYKDTLAKEYNKI